MPAVLADSIKAAHWATDERFSYRQTSHVNLQEARASKAVLRKRAALSLEPERVVSGTDSRVLLGAWAKGRSSSCRLNQILRECLGWSVMSQKKLLQFWLCSADNVGDDPSRFVELRRRVPGGALVEKLVRPAASALRGLARGAGEAKFLGLEAFAGSERLTKAFRLVGLEMALPLDCRPGPEYRREHDILELDVFEGLLELIQAGCFW